MADTFLSVAQLAARFGVNPSTIWRWVQAGSFPKPVSLSPGCTRWRLAEIEAWETARETAN